MSTFHTFSIFKPDLDPTELLLANFKFSALVTCQFSRHWLFQSEAYQNSTTEVLHISDPEAEKVNVKRFFSETKYLLGFFVLMTAVTIFSIWETVPEPPIAVKPHERIRTASPIPLNEVSSVTVEKKSRGPASIPQFKNELVHVNVLCDDLDLKSQQKSSQSLVMLNLNVCTDLKSAASVSIVNITNGFKAQIFKMSAKNYRTDFIQLSEGINILMIDSVLKDGQKRVQTLEILSGS